jgi:hypothetical protein
VPGTFDGDPRCYAVCLHEDDTGRRVEIWQITKEDEYDFPVEGPRQIEAGIVTKAFDFEDNMSLKKLIRCDLWFDDLGGGNDFPFECELAYRPDDYPNFTTWQSFERRFATDFLLQDKNLLAWTEAIDDASWAKIAATVVSNVELAPLGYQTLTADKLTEDTANNQHSINRATPTLVSGATYTYSIYAKAAGRNQITMLYWTAGGSFTTARTVTFTLSGQGSFVIVGGTVSAQIVPLQDGWYRCSITATTDAPGFSTVFIQLNNGVSTSYTGDGNSGVILWGAQVETGTVATAYDPDPPQLLNYERGYAPQVRFPAPPRTANLATDVPAYLGHDFTLRVNWTGRAHLGRLMLHGHRLVENVGGGTL